MGSFEELLADYEDFLTQQNLPLWDKDDSRVLAFRKRAYTLSHISNLSNGGELKIKPHLPETSESAANLLLTLLHQVTFLLVKQITALEEKFLKEGGYSEKLFKRRLEKRRD